MFLISGIEFISDKTSWAKKSIKSCLDMFFYTVIKKRHSFSEWRIKKRGETKKLVCILI